LHATAATSTAAAATSTAATSTAATATSTAAGRERGAKVKPAEDAASFYKTIVEKWKTRVCASVCVKTNNRKPDRKSAEKTISQSNTQPEQQAASSNYNFSTFVYLFYFSFGICFGCDVVDENPSRQ